MNDEKMNDLERTQPMPRRFGSDASGINPQKVRELEPVKVPKRHQEYAEHKEIHKEINEADRDVYVASEPYMPPLRRRDRELSRQNGQKKRLALLLVGFVVAAFLGASLSGYMSEQQARKDALDDQQEQADRQLRAADSQKQSLQQQKNDLEAKYQQLLSQQKEAQSLADQLKGQKEQQAKSTQDKSAAGKVVDKLTGDAGKQQKQAAETEAKENQARQRLAEINQSVDAAAAAVDEVNSQLDNLDSVRQQAQSVKEDVSRAYDENKDVIDSVLHYAALGLESFKGMLAK